MRDESLGLRIVVLAVLLPTVAATCVMALVVAGALHPRIAHMVAAGGAILIVAILAAAISALGPKYRPTPLLTPLFAGTFAALLATVAVYSVHAHLKAPRRVTVATAEVRPAARPVRTASVMESAPAEPDIAPPPKASQTSAPPVFDAETFSQPARAQDQMDVEAQPATPVQPAAEPQPAPASGALENVANAVVTPARAAEAPVAAEGRKPPVAVARIPVPSAAPAEKTVPNPDAPVNLVAGFDPSGPALPAANGPPMALDGAVVDAAPVAPAHHGATPPLPRIRPCGGAGPACP